MIMFCFPCLLVLLVSFTSSTTTSTWTIPRSLTNICRGLGNPRYYGRNIEEWTSRREFVSATIYLLQPAQPRHEAVIHVSRYLRLWSHCMAD
ncbi:hypothetical protein F4824DRAFT_445091 [Ustulina deusta]|nr:hypothetical protein F4824DRAFT_445091 [Ustulina deusta]